jgi:hypothetical protein
VLDPVIQCVRTARDVVFDEDCGWSLLQGKMVTLDATLTSSSST